MLHQSVGWNAVVGRNVRPQGALWQSMCGRTLMPVKLAEGGTKIVSQETSKTPGQSPEGSEGDYWEKYLDGLVRARMQVPWDSAVYGADRAWAMYERRKMELGFEPRHPDPPG